MRKETIVSIVTDPESKEENRDNGRQFLIIEMSAIKTEDWATKALLGIMSSGADVGEVDINGGMQEIARLGLKAITGLRAEFVKPLMDEMLSCCYYLRNPEDKTARQQITVANCGDYIEEVSTLLKLRSETLSLHVGFSIADKVSEYQVGLKEKTSEKPLNTEISPDTSELLSQGEWQQKKS